LIPESLSGARALIAAVQGKAAALGRNIPEPPEEPLPGNCCGRGCEPCIFTVYYRALDEWRKDVERQRI
jgi:hypothetical protein